MKLSALERATADDRDFQDAIRPGIECGMSTVDGLRGVFRTFLAGAELPLAAELRLSELAQAIEARSS